MEAKESIKMSKTQSFLPSDVKTPLDNIKERITTENETLKPSPKSNNSGISTLTIDDIFEEKMSQLNDNQNKSHTFNDSIQEVIDAIRNDKNILRDILIGIIEKDAEENIPTDIEIIKLLKLFIGTK